MTALLDRVRSELQRRTSPPTEVEVRLGHLLKEEIEELRVALNDEPVDVAVVRKMENRARIRQRLGLLIFDRDNPDAHPDPLARWACVKRQGSDWCTCVWDALDSGRRISTRKGLEHHARLFHARRHPPAKPEPEYDPRPEPPLARVLPFRRRKPPPQPVMPDEPPTLDPALQARVPLESLEQLAAHVGVPLMPVPSKEER